jgi:hypothetical protein
MYNFSLRFHSIILRVLRLEVFLDNVYITNQFQTTFAQGEGGVLKGREGVKSVEEVTVNRREENSYWDKSLRKKLLRLFSQSRPRIRTLDIHLDGAYLPRCI